MNSASRNIHGVALAVGDIGIIITGDSGAGKSALAAQMLANWPFGKVWLVADDRVLVSAKRGSLVARPHEAITGRIELRGMGIMHSTSLEAVVLRGIVRLTDALPPRLPDASLQQDELLGTTLPIAILPTGYQAFARLITIWPCFRVQMRND